MVSLCVTQQSALHDAAERGDVAEVDRLIKAGADVNEKDNRNVSDACLISLPTYSSGLLCTVLAIAECGHIR
jgi:hypothetical protein